MSAIIKLFRSRPSRKDRFHELLRPHVELMYRMAYRWTQSQTEAEDLVQDILTRIATRMDEMEQVDSLRPWLLRVLYNRFVDIYRRNRNSPVEENRGEDDASPVDYAIDHRDDIARSDNQRVLLEALEQLEHEHRDVVLLHDMEGYTALEVADIMQISVGTVKSRLHRARARLREYLGSAEAGEKPGEDQ